MFEFDFHFHPWKSFNFSRGLGNRISAGWLRAAQAGCKQLHGKLYLCGSCTNVVLHHVRPGRLKNTRLAFKQRFWRSKIIKNVQLTSVFTYESSAQRKNTVSCRRVFVLSSVFQKKQTNPKKPNPTSKKGIPKGESNMLNKSLLEISTSRYLSVTPCVWTAQTVFKSQKLK